MSSKHSTENPKFTNRLQYETSPYLLQHQHNPVDWYAWGPEAFEVAQKNRKPIFLSVGYSACHWCHVISEESFEDPNTAEIMNQNFINIKVDREERPDVDGIYMDAVQAMTGSGGWPMSVFLTPEGIPFYAGTYFPPEPRYGMPSFKQVLLGVAHTYREKPDDIAHQAQGILDFLQRRAAIESRHEELNPAILDRAVDLIIRHVDSQWGGFGQAPKFPQPMSMEFLLRAAVRTGEQRIKHALKHTLDKMAQGGIYDHLGGGFHRYSTDQKWLVPHFEKMLYDNSQLARLYLHAWQYFGDPHYRRTAIETLDYVVREMTHPEGGFYATQDADSEGVEGKFYVWTASELQQLLEPEEWRVVQGYYDVRPGGNWEGHSILWTPRPRDEVAQTLGIDIATLEGTLRRANAKLFNARATRIPPGTDTKVITSWNGLMLDAFAAAARILGRDDYRAVAERNAEFILTHLRAEDGTLHRTWREGQAKIDAFLEDYANVVNGLITLYEATFAPRWLQVAQELAEIMEDRYWDAEGGGFFDTATTSQKLIVRPKEVIDNATPSGNAMAATALMRLSAYLGDDAMHRAAVQTLKLTGKAGAEQPLGFAQSLVAMDWYLSTPLEFALVGDSAGMAPFLHVIYERYLPNKLVAGQAPDQSHGELIPLLADRTARQGQPTAYLCQHFTCQAPTTDPQELAQQITAALPQRPR